LEEEEKTHAGAARVPLGKGFETHWPLGDVLLTQLRSGA
jgi:hypothetical protein